jgi:hypothetical protein
MGAALAQWEVGTDSADLREARIRAEVRGEASPRLHAMMIEELEAAADALNDRECPLEGSYFALGDGSNPGVAAGVADLIKLATEQDEAHDKALELAKAEAAKERDEVEARYDAMVEERNAMGDRARAAEAALAAATRDGHGLDQGHLQKIADQARSLEVLATALTAAAHAVREGDAALIVARAVLGIEAPARPVRKRVAKVKQ